MLPVESVFQRQDRFNVLIQNLKRLKSQYQRQDTLLLFALQELNPVVSKLDTLKKALMFDGVFSRVNHGLKIGMLSYPFFLDEGLAILWSGSLKNIKVEHHLLSGQAWGWRQQSFFPLCLHLSECRGAIFLSGEFQAKRYLFVNIHMHHSKGVGQGDQRRQEEISKLLELAEAYKTHYQAIFLMGDFNCETGDPALNLFLEAGYKDLRESDSNLYTWDPIVNPYAHLESTLHNDPIMAKWAATQHQLDRIMAWGDVPSVSKIELKFQQYGEICSDHFALQCVLENH